MAAKEHTNDQHTPVDHHDTHDHHDQHDHHDGHDGHDHHHNAPKLDIDYSHFDDRFDNRPIKLQMSSENLELQRELYIMKNALKWTHPDAVAMKFPALEEMKFNKSPQTRNWHRRVSCYERNGLLNVWTMKLNLKIKYWCFYPFLLWGLTNHVFQGIYFDNYNFDEDQDLKVYDKLAQRPIPFARVWSRPG